ncbi:hypothetical protein Taro_031188 [Colocasia esculenta]|uniref:Uncharacterized protein n=1 Tax=Colocasia esculenta TaxID=4460 RepID=A0A843VI93_COLES|nr:hypothetical protein [Colocasia esculenta]
MEWSLLTSGLERRRPSPPRSGRDGKGRSCCGRFGISAEFSSHSRREDVARSGGNTTPCMDCAFFVKLDLSSVTARLRILPVEVCLGVDTIVIVVSEQRLTGCGLIGGGVPSW